jgi:hypothetical protein
VPERNNKNGIEMCCLLSLQLPFISTRSLFNNSHGRNDVNLLFLSLPASRASNLVCGGSIELQDFMIIQWNGCCQSFFLLPSRRLLRDETSNVECRYLFYNSLNKRTQSSLCLFIQFSLRSIISNSLLLLSLSFRRSRSRSFITTRLNGFEQSRVVSYSCFDQMELQLKFCIVMVRESREQCLAMEVTMFGFSCKAKR